jgi:TM2 domain-containing membrane protein YozV
MIPAHIPPKIDERDQWLRSLQSSTMISDKSWTLAFVLSVCFGLFGVDRFYLGSLVLGLAKFCTAGGLGIWWAADMLWLLMGKAKDWEGKTLKRPF